MFFLYCYFCDHYISERKLPHLGIKEIGITNYLLSLCYSRDISLFYCYFSAKCDTFVNKCDD